MQYKTIFRVNGDSGRKKVSQGMIGSVSLWLQIKKRCISGKEVLEATGENVLNSTDSCA